MTIINNNPPPLRIPILPTGKIVDETGMPTQSELAYRQALTDSLQNYVGNEGLVAPTQSPSNTTLIQNNNTVPVIGGPVSYTCGLGTILYVQHPTDYTQDKVMIAVRNDNSYPATPPIFKTVTLT